MITGLPKPPSIKSRAIAYARRYPGQSATQIAHALRAKPTTVSAVLYRAVVAGELWRSNPVVGPNHWGPRQGGGPGGGHVYGPVRDARGRVIRKTSNPQIQKGNRS